MVKRDEQTIGEKRAQAQAAAYKMHAMYDARKTTEAARAVFQRTFDAQIPSELWKSDPQEARRRSDSLRKAYYANLTARSIKARRLKKRGVSA